MSELRPTWEGSDIVVKLGKTATGELIDVVVDVNESGDVLGIEVLGLLARHPGLTIGHDELGGPAVSTDTDADAVYVRFAHGRSVEQLVRQAVVVFDATDHLQTIRVRMEQ